APTATTTTRPPATPDERTASRQLGTLTVAAEGSHAGYERTAFGAGWAIGPDGCDVREEVLVAESSVPVTRRSGPDHCTVVRGRGGGGGGGGGAPPRRRPPPIPATSRSTTWCRWPRPGSRGPAGGRPSAAGATPTTPAAPTPSWR